jgi:hypothetical protein
MHDIPLALNWEEQGGSNTQVREVPTEQSPNHLGRGHKGRASASRHLATPSSWVKSHAQQRPRSQSDVCRPHLVLQVYFANESHLAFIPSCVVLLLHPTQHPNLRCCAQEPRNTGKTPSLEQISQKGWEAVLPAPCAVSGHLHFL